MKKKLLLSVLYGQTFIVTPDGLCDASNQENSYNKEKNEYRV